MSFFVQKYTTLQTMKPKCSLRHQLFFTALTITGFSMLPTTLPGQTARYWDPNSSGNFGTINNTTTWVPNLNIVWTNSPTGVTSRLQNFTTSLTDDCHWGGPIGTTGSGLGGGTVPVGTVNARTLTFGNITSPATVTLSGGTITLAAATSVTANSAGPHTISSTLAGGATSLTKLGTGTINLTGSNTYTGATNVSAGILNIGTNALANSPLNTTGSVLGDASNGLRTTAGSLTFGGLTGNKALSTVFTTTTGGYPGVGSLTLNTAAATTSTYSATIADGAAGMSLTKTGAGTQVFSGENTYTGSTTLSGGILRLDYGTSDTSKLSNAGALILSSGTLELAGGSHTEVVGSTTLAGAVTVTRSAGTAKIAMGAISGTGTIDFAQSNIATTTNANNASGILGSFATVAGTNWAAVDGGGNIVAYAGYLDIDARGPSVIADNATANVRIFGDGTAGSITLGASTTTISTLLQSNATIASTISTASQTLVVNSVTIGAAAESLTIGAAANDGFLRTATTGGSLLLNVFNAGKTLTVNAAISDATSASALIKSGPGALVLGGVNTYTGNTDISEGSVFLHGSLTGSGVLVSGTAILDQSSTGSIAGAVGVTFSSTGSSVLSGNNSYTGTTTVSSGALSIQHASALGSADAGTTVATSATLGISGGIVVLDEALTISGNGLDNNGVIRNVSGDNTWTGPVTLGSSSRIQLDAGSLTLSNTGQINGATFGLTVAGAGSARIDGVINTGTGSLTKEGSGRLTLTGANTYTSASSILGGVVNIRNSTAFGTEAGGVSVVNNAALELEGGITVGNEALSVAGTGIGGTGVLRSISGDNRWGGLVTLAAATRINADANTLTFDVPTGSAFGISLNAPYNITFGGSGNTVVADPISTGTGAILKDGSGTLTLSGLNSFTGGITISAGTVVIGASGNLTSGNYAGAISNDGIFHYQSSANQILSSAITGAGELHVSGPGRLTLTASSTYTGPTKVLEGILQIGNGGTAGSLNPLSAVTTDASLVFNRSDTVIQGVHVSDVIAGTGSLTQAGLGELELNGANTFSGATTLSSGTIVLDYNANNQSKLSDTGELILGTGTLDLRGGSHTEVVGSTTLLPNSTTQITNTVPGSVLQMNQITAGSNSLVNFAAPGIATTDTLNTNGVLGSWAMIAGTDLAMNATNGPDGSIVVYTGYANVPRLTPGVIANAPASNVRLVEGTGSPGNITLGSASTTVNTLLQSTSGGSGAATIHLAGQTFSVNSILMAEGAGSLTIGSAVNDGVLMTAAIGGDLLLANQSLNPLAIASSIQDQTSSSTLTLVGSGVVNLRGDNTFTGNTVLNSGILQLGHPGALGTGGLLINGGKIDSSAPDLELLNGNPVTLNTNLWFVGTENLNTGTGSLALNASRLVTVEAKKLAIGGVISGAFGLTKAGDGILSLTRANSFSGGIVVNAGVLQLGNSGALGSGTLTINGGSLDSSVPNLVNTLNNVQTWTSNVTFIGTESLNLGTGAIALPGSRQVTVNNKTLSLGGVISGAFALTKSGPGTLALTGSNSFGGQLIVAEGTLAVSSMNNVSAAGPLGNSALAVQLGSSGATGTVSYSGATATSSKPFALATDGTGAFHVVNAANTLTLSGAISGAGQLLKSGPGTLSLTNAKTYTGNTTVSAGRLLMAGNLITSSPVIAIGDGAIWESSVVLPLAIGQNINATGATGFITTTASTGLQTTGSNTITAAGTLTITRLDVRGTANVIASGSIQSGGAGSSQRGLLVGNTVASDLTIPVGASLTTLGSGTGAQDIIGNGTAGDGELIINGGSYTATAGLATLQLGNGVANSGGGVLTIQAGSATIGNITYQAGTSQSGIVNLNGGTLTLGSISVISGAARVLNFDGGQFVASANLPAFSGLTMNVKDGGARIDTNGFSFGLSDALVKFAGTSTGGLIKGGAGTLTLSGANTYTGATAVNGGTLALVGGSQASPVTVSAGASLGFTIGSPTTSTSTFDLSAGTIKITGTPTGASHTLITSSAGITGTPVLDAPITGYELKVEGNSLKLVKLGYASWSAVNGAGANLNDDHDTDGVPNGVEYFLGGPNGNTTGFTALPSVTNAAGTLSVTWVMGSGYAGVYGSNFTVETSDTLTGTWTTESLGVTVTVTGSNVKYTFPTPLGSKRFARLKVTGP
jgi:fibronectin-binding autotransporter adhesin